MDDRPGPLRSWVASRSPCVDHRPPCLIAVLLGVLPTFIVLVALVAGHSVWAAVFGVEVSWVLSPALVCFFWPASWSRVSECFHAATQRVRLQLMVGGVLYVGSAGGAVLLFWLLGRHTGVIPTVRERAAEFGLSETHPSAVFFFIAWFSLVNPVLEELFWRLFLMAHLLPSHLHPTEAKARGRRPSDETLAPAAEPPASPSAAAARLGESAPINGGGLKALGWPAWWGWPAAAVAASALYAAYHFSVLLLFLPLPFALLGELFVFGYGCFLQLLTRRLGVIASILTHAGGDAVIAFVLADCIWDFLPLLRRL